MTPQDLAGAVLAACGANRGNPVRARLTALIGATAIRAAVELVLPEEPGPEWSDPREMAYDYQRQSRVNARAQFLAIADALEAPTNG
jgi:hypothetical protein